MSALLVLAGSSFMPARLVRVSAGTRLPPGVPVIPATAVLGSGSRATGLVVGAAAGADQVVASGELGTLSLNDAGALAFLSIGDASNASLLGPLSLDAGALTFLSIGDITNASGLAPLPIADSTEAGVLSFLPIDAPLPIADSIEAGVLSFLPIDAPLPIADSIEAGVLSFLPIDAPLPIADSTEAGVLSFLPIDAPLSIADSTEAGVLSFLPIDDSSAGAAAAARARGRGGLLFLGGDASAGFGISSAALASAAGGRASRGRRLVVAAAAGSEADGGVDNGSEADSTKVDVDFFLLRKKAILREWELLDLDDASYSPMLFSAGDAEMFQESAAKGMRLMRLMLDKGLELDYSNADMTALLYAGKCVGRVFLQAQHGYVFDWAVWEAMGAMEMVYKTLPSNALGAAGSATMVYSKMCADAFASMIADVGVAVDDKA